MDSWRVRTDPSRVSFVCVRASNTLWDLCEFPIQQTPAFYTRVYLDDSYTFADSHRAFLAHFDCSCRLRYCAKRRSLSRTNILLSCSYRLLPAVRPIDKVSFS